MNDAPGPTTLIPLPYLRAIADHLAKTEAEAWQWFRESLAGPERTQEVRLSLLKEAFRIERESHPELYDLADKARERLGVDTPLTLYQLQQPHLSNLNGGLYYLPEEIHITLVGPVLERLEEPEILALLGHEIGHFMLLDGHDHRYRITGELLHSLLHDSSAQAVHEESYKLFRLYQEIYSDRAALVACGDLHATISTLVKLATGSGQIVAEDYIRQAHEILSQAPDPSEGTTHPEHFIRTRALELWTEDPPDLETQVSGLIEGGLKLDRLDLLGQVQVTALTRRLLDAILIETWMRSDSVMAQTRLFFSDYRPPDETTTEIDLAPFASVKDSKLKQYFCYLLLDFIACDRDLEEPALAAALLLSRRLEMEDIFGPIAVKELKLKKRQFQQLEEQAQAILTAARRQEEEA